MIAVAILYGKFPITLRFFGNEEKEEPKLTVEPVPTIKVIDID